MTAEERIIIALDFASLEETRRFLTRLGPFRGKLKVGLELFVREGLGALDALHRADRSIFLDLKYHDIPNTVAGALRSAFHPSIGLTTIHLAGGAGMIRSAVDAVGAQEQAGAEGGVLLLGVTVLTSMDEEQLCGVGVMGDVAGQVLRLADVGFQNGLRGFVASPQEICALRKRFGSEITIVTPGVRPAGAALNDQRRTMTPGEAVAAGADFLVVGRPITGAGDPREALAAIVADIESVAG